MSLKLEAEYVFNKIIERQIVVLTVNLRLYNEFYTNFFNAKYDHPIYPDQDEIVKELRKHFPTRPDPKNRGGSEFKKCLKVADTYFEKVLNSANPSDFRWGNVFAWMIVNYLALFLYAPVDGKTFTFEDLATRITETQTLLGLIGECFGYWATKMKTRNRNRLNAQVKTFRKALNSRTLKKLLQKNDNIVDRKLILKAMEMLDRGERTVKNMLKEIDEDK